MSNEPRPRRERKPELRPNRNKGLEMLAGAGIAFIIDVLVYYLVMYGDSIVPKEMIPTVVGGIMVLMVLLTVGTVKLYKKGYPELGMGILGFFLFPVIGLGLLFGSCMMILS